MDMTAATMLSQCILHFDKRMIKSWMCYTAGRLFALQTHAETVSCHGAVQLKKGQKLESLPTLDKGILFCTYDLLISGAKRKSKDEKEALEPEEEFGGCATASWTPSWQPDVA